MECIICQDTGSEPLQDNSNCPCKYKRHASCWIDYVHSKNKLICPMCRTDLSVKRPVPTVSTPLTQSRLPYTPQVRTVSEPHGRVITYQEFVDTIHQNTVIQVAPSAPPPEQIQKPPQVVTAQKLLKLVILLGIIAIVITFIVIFT
jgi:hypothetical protein